MSDWRATQEQLHKDVEAKVRASCAGQYALANMFSVVAEEHILPKMRELAAEGRLKRMEVDGLDLRIVRVWNGLMPEHVPPKNRFKADEERQWNWIVFADLLSEDIQSRKPDVIADNERVGLMGFGEDEDMRQRAADAVVESVMPLLTRGVLPPVMCRATECKATGEWVKFGLSGWTPILMDMNDTPIPFAYGGQKQVLEDDSPSP